MSTTEQPDVLTLERRGHVLLIGLNRPQKRNAFNTELLMELGRAYELLERDDDLRCGVLFAHGDHFTGGRRAPCRGHGGPAQDRGRR